jgi:hypothetical protein
MPTMQQLMRFFNWAAPALLLMPAGAARAQLVESVARVSWSFETMAAGYQTSHPEAGPIGLGVALGIGYRLREQLAARFMIRAFKTITVGDDIALCHLRPDGSCVPDSTFPSSLWMADIVAAYQPHGALPIHGLIGAGIMLPIGPAAGDGAVDNPHVPPAQSSWQLGLETALGRSQRAPRLQLTRIMPLRNLMSLDALLAITVRFRLG